jgi:hypothetical protein
MVHRTEEHCPGGPRISKFPEKLGEKMCTYIFNKYNGIMDATFAMIIEPLYAF